MIKNDDFSSMLHTAGFKATPHRLALLRVLSGSKAPLAVEKIIKKMERIAPDPATVYRAVNELKEAGLINRVDFGHDHAHYEIANREDHHHLVCMKCGKVEDFTGCNVGSIIKKALKQTKQFRAVQRHSIELFGVCAACAKKA
jgi:Fe2+ or Zn2+ uptake regulation protein